MRKNISRNFLKNFFIYILVFSWIFGDWLQVFNFPPKIKYVQADTTLILLPIADGGNDSALWENIANTACDTADCYLEIDESSGSSCTNSDGDTSYISSNKGGESQTFDIDESSIPDNSTITQIDITVCHVKEGGSGGTFQTQACHNGSCTSSGLTISTGAGYIETTQQILVNYTKSGSSDIEIGVIDINVAKEVRISQISTLITYTISTSEDIIAPAAVIDLALSNPFNVEMTASWTASGDDENTGIATAYDLRYSISEITEDNWSLATQVSGEPTPSVAGSSESMIVSDLSEDTTYYFALKTFDEVFNESALSNIPSLATTMIDPPLPSPIIPLPVGGGVAPTTKKMYIHFSGQAYPGSEIELLTKNEETETLTSEPLEKFTTLEDGTFEIIQEDISDLQFFFILRAEDKNGRKSGILAFDVDLESEDGLIVQDIFFPPTVDFENIVVTKNQNVRIMGYAAPNNKIEVKIDDIIKGEARSDEAGYWNLAISALELDFGEHYVRVRQINKFDIESNFSFPRAFKVSPLEMSRADFNNDNKVNITDWSIFLFRWGSEDESLKSKIDMNNDGNINIRDFSIFLKIMKI